MGTRRVAAPVAGAGRPRRPRGGRRRCRNRAVRRSPARRHRVGPLSRAGGPVQPRGVGPVRRRETVVRSRARSAARGPARRRRRDRRHRRRRVGPRRVVVGDQRLPRVRRSRHGVGVRHRDVRHLRHASHADRARRGTAVGGRPRRGRCRRARDRCARLGGWRPTDVRAPFPRTGCSTGSATTPRSRSDRRARRPGDRGRGGGRDPRRGRHRRRPIPVDPLPGRLRQGPSPTRSPTSSRSP